jgi:tetratricopeptide (TPR) repeat protein
MVKSEESEGLYMKKYFFAVCFAALAAVVFGQNGSTNNAPNEKFPRLTPDVKAVEYAAFKNYGWKELAEIALWASGVDPYAAVTVNKAKTTYMAVLESLVGELSGAVTESGGTHTDTEKAEAVLRFMYEKTLKRYSLNQTQLDVLLSAGTYNCVSSAVFYLILGTSAGLDIQGVVTRDHAFITVHADGSDDLIDIETTNKFGFNPGSKKEFTDDFGKTTGFAYVPPGNYRNRAQISPIELVSLIISNRISALESRKRFADALPLAIDRAVLLESREHPTGSPLFSDPARDRMDRIFNVAGSLLNSRKEDETLAFVDYAMPVYPDDARWEEIQYNAVNNIIAKHLRANKIADAKTALTDNQTRYNEIQHARLAEVVAKAEAVSFHNQFAALFNRRKYDDAKAVLDLALKTFPEDRQLNRDLETVNKALNG